jgi:predicted dehydrogenase
MSEPLRFGILGAAKIAPAALVRPARLVAGARVVGIAARDGRRARRFARKHGIPTVHDSYASLLADPGIDAIYNPLPNGLHCEWTIRALKAGKHVLCEKPMAANALQAQRMAEAADAAGRVLVEAFHWRYHPLASRMREVVQGEIGALRCLEASMCFPLPLFSDIRYRYDLAGGATMDAGCYPINVVRFLAGAEPEVVSASAKLRSDTVDRAMRADLRFPDGLLARVTCSLWSSDLVRLEAVADGQLGTMRVFNPIMPHVYHRLTLYRRGGEQREHVQGDASYTCQLRAFVDHVRGGETMSTDAWDAVANMRVIDAIYRAAGLPLRGERAELSP